MLLVDDAIEELRVRREDTDGVVADDAIELSSSDCV